MKGVNSNTFNLCFPNYTYRCIDGLGTIIVSILYKPAYIPAEKIILSCSYLLQRCFRYCTDIYHIHLPIYSTLYI